MSEDRAVMWMLTSGDYSDWDVHGIYTDKAEADRAEELANLGRKAGEDEYLQKYRLGWLLAERRVGSIQSERDELQRHLDTVLLPFAQRTQARDWARLNEALRNALNGTWSIECGGIVGEIVESHAVAGAWTPDTAIPYGPLLLDGIYEAITGIPVSEETLAGCRRYFARFPDRRVFAGSAAEAKKAAEEARGGR